MVNGEFKKLITNAKINITTRRFDSFSDFTEGQFKQLFKGQGSQKCVFRVHRDNIPPTTPLLDVTALTGDVIKLCNPENNDSVQFEIHDFNESDGKDINHDSQEAFENALQKLFYDIPSILPDTDFQWKCKPGTAEEVSGQFRPSQGIYITPEIRDILREAKFKDGGRFEVMFELNAVTPSPDSIKIIVPGSSKVHNVPVSSDGYTEQPEEIWTAINEKTSLQTPQRNAILWSTYRLWAAGNSGEKVSRDKGTDVGPVFDMTSELIDICNRPGREPFVIKPWWDDFCILDVTGQDPTIDLPTDGRKWTPTNGAWILQFWRKIDALYAGKPISNGRPVAKFGIKRIFDQAITSWVTRDYDETKFKTKIFETLDAGNIYVEGR